MGIGSSPDELLHCRGDDSPDLELLPIPEFDLFEAMVLWLEGDCLATLDEALNGEVTIHHCDDDVA
jgi:hypothetical protein